MIITGLLAQGGSVWVSEGLGAPKLFVLGKERVEIEMPFRHHAGIVGWSFDLTPDCRMVLAKSTKASEGVFPTTLELHHVDRERRLQFDRTLTTSTAGISSPAFSPDSGSVAYVDGTSVTVLDVESGARRVLGEGRAAMWDETGAVIVYRIDDKKCHVLERFSGGVKTELDHRCGGEIARPVSAGLLPKGAPLAVTGAHDAVEALLGVKGGSWSQTVSVRGAGVACKKGIVYETRDGALVSVAKTDAGWAIVDGAVCYRPTAKVDEKTVKTQQCSVPR